MKILFIHNYFHIKSGSGSIMFSEAKILRDQGHEVFFFTTDKKPFAEKDYKYSKYFPKYFDYKSSSKFELIKNFYKPFYNFEAEKKLSELLDEIRPDIVHNHTLFFHLTPSVLKACYKKNIPVVMTMHGSGYMCPAQTLMKNGTTYCEKELCTKGNYTHCLINKCLNMGLVNNLATVSIHSFYKIMNFHTKISAFICPSQAMLDIAHRSGIDKEKLYLINNCLDAQSFQIQPEYDNKGYFLYVGRLDKEKGLHDLLDAMSMLPREIKLHIVGIGNEEDKLKKQANDLNLHNVEFLGFKSGSDLEGEYKHCIATILPCNWFENFPTTILESYTYGKPVIASRLGGIPEMIDNGINGFTFKAGNIEELAKTINKLYLDKSLVINMGQNARAKVEKSYNPKTHYHKLLEVYQLFDLKNKEEQENENIVCS